MNAMLKAMYNNFYAKPEMTVLESEIKNCHKQLIEHLDKTDRRLVLRIIDAQDHICNATSQDSFIAGFQLAWKLCSELNHYDEGRCVQTSEAERSALLLFTDENDQS